MYRKPWYRLIQPQNVHLLLNIILAFRLPIDLLGDVFRNGWMRTTPPKFTTPRDGSVHVLFLFFKPLFGGG